MKLQALLIGIVLGSVIITNDVKYGRAHGYWAELEGPLTVNKPSLNKRDLDLTLDLYQPENLDTPRPLILFIHGGAFYFGSKKDRPIMDMCEYFAGLGYVTASINYRMGFNPDKKEILQAEDNTLQDAHTALGFLCAHAEEYHIDPGRVFIVGASAGAITALRLAFSKEEERHEPCRIVAVANLWGAVRDLSILENARTSIVSFHGMKDNIVAYGHDFPFLAGGKALAKLLSDEMYGSSCIDAKADSLGLRHRFYSYPAEGHGINSTTLKLIPNEKHPVIREHIRDFFAEELDGSYK